MKLKVYSIIVLALCFIQTHTAQQQFSGSIKDASTGKVLQGVEIYEKSYGLLGVSNEAGNFDIKTKKASGTLIFFSYEYNLKEFDFDTSSGSTINVDLTRLSEELKEVEIIARKSKVFELSRLKDVEETTIYAGKKTEVIQVESSMANLATNNARQLYSQVAGLNIYQNDDAGLQLNIGGRGLDPNRTSNFNTRQNGYDISADVLGYPESYYSPPAEGLSEIQIVRGAASLQYGTQFGGLINFKMKAPNSLKPIEVITRNTGGSFGLYTNFTSLSGTSEKWSYYTFVNYKRGDGFRSNSGFESINVFGHIGYQLSLDTKITAEVTYLNYLAQQAGGLTDDMFEEDPYQSNRSRNWFEVDWFLYNIKLAHNFSDKTTFTFNFFGLNAQRNALGFRSNRVDQVDPGTERDLIKGSFGNFGFETRLVSSYRIGEKNSTFLVGAKYYNASNSQQQGPGSDGSDPDFNFYFDDFPTYPNQSDFDFPNLNVALFGENIFYLSNKFSVTPGIRFEYIKTQSNGFYREIRTDNAGNVIFDEIVEENRSFERAFLLLGVGLSYKANKALEVYGNISQNYRSVTFSDININNPAFAINPNIKDEDGYSVDLGIRGNYNRVLNYDVNAFSVFYNNRIGLVQKQLDDGRVVAERGNVGDAVMLGLESLLDFNLKQVIGMGSEYWFNAFINSAFITSQYVRSEQPGIEGNEVEFVPRVNIKTGIRFGYKNLMSNLQFTYVDRQFTDATNAVESNISGIIGQIPAYEILDFSLAYTYKIFRIEAGVNNLLDKAYFTRRATGYPGPGIIPSPPRNFFVTLQLKF